MAHIRKCTYCPKTVANAAWHPECRMEYLEDLVWRTREALKKNAMIPLPLKNEIGAQNVRSLFTLEMQRANKNNRKKKKELWELARQDHLQKCAEEFEKKHPDPNPILYG